jgi:membrane-bound ClpP family serine protease
MKKGERHKETLGHGPAIRKYVLLQLPGIGLLVVVLLVLQERFDLSGTVFWIVVAVWIGKDAALYPFVWRAYISESGTEALMGVKGVALEALDPSGYIFVNGERWKARLGQGERTIQKGSPVIITGREGLTLIVCGERGRPELREGRVKIPETSGPGPQERLERTIQ